MTGDGGYGDPGPLNFKKLFLRPYNNSYSLIASSSYAAKNIKTDIVCSAFGYRNNLKVQLNVVLREL
jgi:hypothetical protein